MHLAVKVTDANGDCLVFHISHTYTAIKISLFFY